MDPALAAVGPPSHDLIVGTWLGVFALAIGVLAAVWFFAPGAKQLLKESVKGKDGRVSTSKFQFVMWTFVVFFALFSVLIAWAGVHFFGDLLGKAWAESLREQVSGGIESFVSGGLTDTYALLLGIPVAGAVASKGITASKVGSGAIVKAPKEEGSDISGARELIGDDDGDVDLGDFQYFLFNLLAVGYFLVLFFSKPEAGLPEMPDTLIALTGVAAAGYIAKKSIYSEPPLVLGIMPPSALPGEEVRIYGERLVAAPSAGTAVAAGDQPGAEASPELPIGAIVTFNLRAAEIVGQPADGLIVVKVPAVDPGSAPVQVIRPPGAKSEALPFTVIDPAPVASPPAADPAAPVAAPPAPPAEVA